MQWQLLRQVERPVQARVVQLALVLVLAQARESAQVERRAQVLAQARQPARVVQLALAQARQPALARQVRAQQPHSPHQQLQSLCQPELCHLH